MTKKEQDILDTALVLFVSKGFHGTPTSLIAQKAGVSNGTLFHYYSSKDALVRSLYKNVLHEYESAVIDGVEEAESIKEKIQILWKQSIDWSFKNKDKYRFIFQYEYATAKEDSKNERGKQLKKRFAEITEKGIQQRQLDMRPDDFIYTMFEANLYGMMTYLFENPVKYRMPEFMKQSFNWFWGSVSPR